MKRPLELSDINLHREPVDFRKSIYGLTLIGEQEMQLSPFGDALFVFCNKARDKLKVVYWDKTGGALWYKRLEKDKFKWPRKHAKAVISLTDEQWRWLLSGLDVTSLRTHQALKFQSLR